MFAFRFAFVAVCLWSAPTVAQSPEAEAAVAAFHAALERGDAQGALALMAEDAVVYEQGMAERSRAEYEAQHLAADAEFAQAVSTARTVQHSHAVGETAWVLSDSRTTGRYAEAEVDRIGKETMILRKVGADWRIVHIHWSGRAAPKP